MARKKKTRHTRQLKRFLFVHRHEGCQACGTLEDPTVDHVVPRDLRGSSRKQNLMILCNTCNSNKRNQHPMAWFESLPIEQRTEKLRVVIQRALDDYKPTIIIRPEISDNLPELEFP